MAEEQVKDQEQNANVTTTTEVVDEPIKEEFVADNQNWLAVTMIQKKGKGAGNDHTVFMPNENEKYSDFLKRVSAAVGEANFEKAIATEVIRQACRDAEKDAENEANKAGRDGKYDLADLWAKFKNWFVSGRAAGEGVKQIRERLIAVIKEMEPLMAMSLKKETKDKMTPDQLNRLLQLMAEFSELNEKEEGKRKTKKATK